MVHVVLGRTLCTKGRGQVSGILREINVVQVSGSSVRWNKATEVISDHMGSNLISHKETKIFMALCCIDELVR